MKHTFCIILLLSLAACSGDTEKEDPPTPEVVAELPAPIDTVEVPAPVDLAPKPDLPPSPACDEWKGEWWKCRPDAPEGCSLMDPNWCAVVSDCICTADSGCFAGNVDFHDLCVNHGYQCADLCTVKGGPECWFDCVDSQCVQTCPEPDIFTPPEPDLEVVDADTLDIIEPEDVPIDVPEPEVDVELLPDIVDTGPDVCTPNCAGKTCGDDGCGGLCGYCDPDCEGCAGGVCVGCPVEYVEIEPSCVHIPYMVQAGDAWPIAVFVETTSCAEFDHVDMDLQGSNLKIKIMGLKNDWACPPCIFNYVGMLWMEDLIPGGYTVQVGSAPAQYMVASGGDIPAPNCTGVCAPSLGDGWTLTRISGDGNLSLGCGDYQNLSSSATFVGDCNDHTLVCDEWTGPTKMSHCTASSLFFDVDAPPFYGTTATRCTGPWSLSEEMIIGTLIMDMSTEMFIIER